MQAFRAKFILQSAFGTPLKGDTLFGQLCWVIRNRLGEAKLNDCLNGYTSGDLFAVVSDAFPQGYLPLPRLPGCFYYKIDGADRKAIKKRSWLPDDATAQPISKWLSLAVDAKTVAFLAKGKDATSHLTEKYPQPRNSINRRTNTTGTGFDPYNVEQEWSVPGIAWSVYLLLDTERLIKDDCEQCLQDIGNISFGRDANIGLGKFTLTEFVEQALLSRLPNIAASITFPY